MVSYTWGSPEGIEAVVSKLDLRTPMELDHRDMEALIRALVETSEVDCREDDDSYVPEHHDDMGACLDRCWRHRGIDLVSSLAEVHGVDWI
jgi:hypothetical protein